MHNKYYVIHKDNVIINGDNALDLYILERVAPLCRNKKDLSVEMSEYYKNNVVIISSMKALILIMNESYKEIK